MVKRSEAGMVTNPVTCGPDATLAEVEALCARYRISGVPVVDPDGRLVGIVTNRDMRFETTTGAGSREVMTPMPLVTAPVGVSRDEALGLLAQHKVEKLPLVDDAGRLRGLITVKDFTKSEKYPRATKDADGRLRGRRRGRRRRGRCKRARRRWSRPASTSSSSTPRTATRGACSTWSPRLKADAPRIDVIGGNVATGPGAQALDRRRRRRRQGRRRARLDLHHPGRRRRRRPAGHRDLRGAPRPAGRPACR